MTATVQSLSLQVELLRVEINAVKKRIDDLEGRADVNEEETINNRLRIKDIEDWQDKADDEREKADNDN